MPCPPPLSFAPDIYVSPGASVDISGSFLNNSQVITNSKTVAPSAGGSIYIADCDPARPSVVRILNTPVEVLGNVYHIANSVQTNVRASERTERTLSGHPPTPSVAR